MLAGHVRLEARLPLCPPLSNGLPEDHFIAHSPSKEKDAESPRKTLARFKIDRLKIEDPWVPETE